MALKQYPLDVSRKQAASKPISQNTDSILDNQKIKEIIVDGLAYYKGLFKATWIDDLLIDIGDIISRISGEAMGLIYEAGFDPCQLIFVKESDDICYFSEFFLYHKNIEAYKMTLTYLDRMKGEKTILTQTRWSITKHLLHQEALTLEETREILNHSFFRQLRELCPYKKIREIFRISVEKKTNLLLNHLRDINSPFLPLLIYHLAQITMEKEWYFRTLQEKADRLISLFHYALPDSRANRQKPILDIILKCADYMPVLQKLFYAFPHYPKFTNLMMIRTLSPTTFIAKRILYGDLGKLLLIIANYQSIGGCCYPRRYITRRSKFQNGKSKWQVSGSMNQRETDVWRFLKIVQRLPLEMIHFICLWLCGIEGREYITNQMILLSHWKKIDVNWQIIEYN